MILTPMVLCNFSDIVSSSPALNVSIFITIASARWQKCLISLESVFGMPLSVNELSNQLFCQVSFIGVTSALLLR